MNWRKIIIFIIFFSLFLNLSSAPTVKADSASTNVTVTLIACGNNLKEEGEACDGTDLNGKTCSTLGLGYTQGTLTCAVNCTFNTTQCSSGGGGGGGGGGSYSPPQQVERPTVVSFTGKAFPKTKVTLLKDAQVATSVVIGPDANFTISLNNLSAGNYIFSLYTEDKYGLRSNLLTFPVSVTSGATTQVSGIFIAPTINVDKETVKRGENIAILGQSFPKSEITISINSENEIFAKTNADKDGIYLYNFDTSVLEMGDHYTKSKAAINGELSGYSKSVTFTVGDKTVSKSEQKKKADVNKDTKVNLVDFSVLAYWHGKASPPASVDLNGDGKVNLVDFSIMAFYWEG